MKVGHCTVCGTPFNFRYELAQDNGSRPMWFCPRCDNQDVKV